MMKIRAGYAIGYDCPQPTPMILALSVHPSRRHDLVTPDQMRLHPSVPTTAYRDGFDNICHVVWAPAGPMTISADFLIEDSGQPDPPPPSEGYHPLDRLPVETLVYLLGSRYCETDRLSDFAWATFGHVPKGGELVRTICAFVHDEIAFGYEHANQTRTAYETLKEGRGVCRDFAHLAIALCRCMNIPARYCTGYLGDIGIPPVDLPMDFSAWFEAYLGGRWYTFDARHNVPRIGRILIAHGRDATDVAIVTSFGPHKLASFNVTTDEAVVVPEAARAFL
jgi:transglutaminase-like putative cysteine protease